MIRRTPILIAALLGFIAQTWAADFDRQAFLAAVKERFKSEPALMELRSPYDSTLRIESFPAKTVGWQKDLISIPSLGQNVSFGVALAYLASQELGLPFSSRSGAAVVNIDANQTIASLNQVPAWGNVLLQTVFDEKSSCAIDRNVFRNTQADLEFANSLCRDLKQILSDARSEFKDQQLLSEKEATRSAIQRTQEQIVSTQHSVGDNLDDARSAANEELRKTQTLLEQTKSDHGEYGNGWYGLGGEGRKSVVEIQQKLEGSLAGENEGNIKAFTHALQNANERLELFIQQRTNTATVPAVAPRKIDAFLRDDNWFGLGILLIAVVVFGFFSIPTIVAFSRRHRSRWVILVLNLAFGVTLIGWVIALIWALNKVDDPVKGGMKIGPAPPDPIL